MNKEQQEAREFLKKVCPVGSTIYGKFVHVNRSGESRIYSFHVVYKGELYTLNGYLKDAFGYRVKETSSSGTGIDTGFDDGESLVMNMSVTLWGDSYQYKYRRLV